jgi:hypothetical protein
MNALACALVKVLFIHDNLLHSLLKTPMPAGLSERSLISSVRIRAQSGRVSVKDAYFTVILRKTNNQSWLSSPALIFYIPVPNTNI